MEDRAEMLTTLLRDRRSVRRFRPDPVPEEKLDAILEAARWAPSAGNRQSWRLIVVTAEARRTELARAVEEAVLSTRQGLRTGMANHASAYLDNFTHFARAPVVVAPIYRVGPDLLQATQRDDAPPVPGADLRRLDAVCSVSAAIQNLLLAAHAQGLGACWMTGPLVAVEALGPILEVPRGWTLAALIPVGYAYEIPDGPARRPLERLVRRLDS